MTHYLVHQLHFARREFLRCLDGVTEEEGQQRLGQMNCISWMVGHLANQENRFWVSLGQGIEIHSDLNELVGYGKPASQPSYKEMMTIWKDVTSTADRFLADLDEKRMGEFMEISGKKIRENIGTSLMRNFYHYWFHIGEAHAVRQSLGHQKLPQFVGNFMEDTYKVDAA